MTSLTVTALAWLLVSCSIAARAAEAPSPPGGSAGGRSTSIRDLMPPAQRDYMARTGVTPSCLAVEDIGDFPDLRPLKGLIPMTMAELKSPSWKMLHTLRVPTEEEKVALRAYGLKYTGCVKVHIEVCKMTSEGLQKTVCSIPDYVDLQANELLKILVSGGGTFDSYTGAVTVIAAGYEAAAIRALALQKTLQAKQSEAGGNAR
jgi:hypothetical protein